MLTREEVKNIAHLARIGLSDEEVELYRKDLSSALDWFTALKEAKTDGVAPIGHITGEHNRTLGDEVTPVSPEECAGILENMPRKEGSATKVKSVF